MIHVTLYTTLHVGTMHDKCSYGMSSSSRSHALAHTNQHANAAYN